MCEKVEWQIYTVTLDKENQQQVICPKNIINWSVE